MDLQRNFLLIIWLFVSFIIWQTWQKYQIKSINTNLKIKPIIINNDYYDSTKFITVKTDVLQLRINLQGGDIEEVLLLNYPSKLHLNEPFRLLETSNNFLYQAQSGIIGPDGPDNPKYKLRPLYSSIKKKNVLLKFQNELRIPLTFINIDGVNYQKTYIFKRGKYNISVEYKIINYNNKPIKLVFFGQLKQNIELPKEHDIGFNNLFLHTYRGAAFSSDNINYKKYTFNDIKDNDLKINTQNGWIAMLQQYFANAWIPSNKNQNTFYSTYLNKSMAIIGYKTSEFVIDVNNEFNYISTLWIGPELQSEMAIIAPHLDLTVDYGWLWFISQPLFKLLKFIYSFIGNWGFSIIIITFIVRGIMYPLTKAQYTSMAKMRLLQPKFISIREKYGNDKQRMSQEMLALYKKEKVNSLGGCLPVLIQMPIFLALYYMLIGSVELRNAPFIGWIHDLSMQDPYYILPILMGLTMFFIQKMSPTTVTDPMQQKIMIYMPFVFTIFFLWFPSGLVLYYIISNVVTMLQQQMIYRGLEKKNKIK